jgi:uncharacterized protein (TIGR03437 family)
MRRIPFLFLTAFALAALLHSYPNGSRVPNGNAGEPGSGTPCASCHTVTLNPSGGAVAVALPSGSAYTPGEKQKWTVTVTDPDSSRAKGFQLTASAGSFTALSGTVVNSASSGRQYVNQSASASSYSFEWTPPASGEAVTVWVAGVAARGTRQTNVYTASTTLAPAASSAAKPTLSASGAVVNGASLTAGVSPGSWVTIFGKNLAPAGVARTWKADEIVDGALPISLEGTSVRINGKAAAVYYVSETQLNVQAPDDVARGAVAVDVTTSAGTSDAVSTTLSAAAPALFRYSPGEGKYAAAVHADGVIAAAPGLFGSAATERAAKPGDTILVFGTGFGATSPAVPALHVYSGAAPLQDGAGLRIRIGGVEATVAFAGLTGAGLYQFNLVVPEVADGDHKIEGEVAGVAFAGEAYLTVRR